MVQGVDKLKRRWIDVMPRLIRVELEQAMIEGANLIMAGARIRVPVDEGRLRDSIRSTGVREGKRGGLYVAITAGERTEKGYNTARIVEFGTVDTPAQPFLLPAYRANRRRVRARMRKAIREAVARV